MALVQETVTTFTYIAPDDSRSVTIAGASNALFVILAKYNTGTEVSAMTYGGNALAQVTNSPVKNESNVDQVMVWYLANPPTGANTLAITDSATGEVAVGVVPFSGCHVSGTPHSTPQTAVSDNTTTPTSIVVSSAAGEIVIDFQAVRHLATNGTITAGGGQTEIIDMDTGTTTDDVKLGVSTEPGASSVTMSWTSSQVMYWAQMAFAVKPAPAGAAGGGSHMLLGIG
jgi:hypothetical protein